VDVGLSKLNLRRKRQNREYRDPPPPNRVRGADVNAGAGWARLQVSTSEADGEPYTVNSVVVIPQDYVTCDEFAGRAVHP
jgi:hypothetical protein